MVQRVSAIRVTSLRARLTMARPMTIAVLNKTQLVHSRQQVRDFMLSLIYFLMTQIKAAYSAGSIKNSK